MKKPVKAAPLHAAQSIQRTAKPECTNGCSSGPITDELATIAALCTCLEKSAARLAERFGSVLSPTQETNDSALLPPCASMLHAELQGTSSRLRQLDADLCTLHDRCTL